MDVENNEFWKNITIPYSDLQKYGKKEKKKKSVNFKYLSRKRKPKKAESKRQELLTKLLKKKTQKRDDVIALMVNEGIQAGQEDIDQYNDLSKMISFNKRYTLPASIVSGEFYVYVLSKEKLKTSKITSDLLYWANKCYNDIDDEYKVFLSLDKVRVSSIEASVVQGSLDIVETYVNDFNVNVSAPFFNKATSIAVNDLYKYYSKTSEFKMNGRNMYELSSKELGLQDSLVYTYEESPWSNTFRIIQESEYINSEGGVLKKGVKTLSKKPGVYYFDKDIVPTTFCPVSLDLRNELTAYVAYRLQLNLDEYINECVKKNKILAFEGFVNFGNMDKFMTLIEIVFTSMSGSSKGVKDVLEYYKSNKEAFVAVKKHYLHFQKIVLGYLDAFRSKINLDVLTRLLEEVNVYISDDEFLMSSKVEIETLSRLFNADKIFYVMKNYLDVKVRNAVDLIKHSILKATTPPDKESASESLEINIRSTAMVLFDFLLTGKSTCIPTIRSPAAFLGNIVGNNSVTTLKDNIDSYFDKLSVMKKTENEIAKQVNDLVAKGQETARMKLLKDVADYVAEGKYDDVKRYLLSQGFLKEKVVANTDDKKRKIEIPDVSMALDKANE